MAVGAEHRRTTLALDSISVELSFMTGPAIAVVAATTWSTRGVLLVVGAAQMLAGVGDVAAQPAGPQRRAASRRPGRGRAGHRRAGGRAARRCGRPAARARTGVSGRAWFTLPLLAVFASGTGAALVLAGSEVAVVAQLRHLGHLSFTGVVFVIWGITSIVGGFVYGALHRELPPAVVLLGLAVLTLPIGLASGPAAASPCSSAWPGCSALRSLTATSTAVTHLVRGGVPRRGDGLAGHGDDGRQRHRRAAGRLRRGPLGGGGGVRRGRASPGPPWRGRWPGSP